MPEKMVLEDFVEGKTVDCGSVTVTEEEIIEFAERYDPQPFHMDPEAAEDHYFDGLVASGINTVALCVREAATAFLIDTENLGSPGIQDIRFYKPVRPGDVLSVETEILGVEPDAGDDERGLVEIQLRAVNQRREKVISMTMKIFFAKRESNLREDV